MTEELTQEQKDQVADLLGNYEQKYHRILLELDSLSEGTFDEDESSSRAAMCLITQSALLSDLAAADLRSRSLKRDIDFAKAKAYAELKNNPPDGKKITESALAQLIVTDDEVQRVSKEQIEAERDYKYLANIHALLKEAHLTFRSVKKGA